MTLEEAEGLRPGDLLMSCEAPHWMSNQRINIPRLVSRVEDGEVWMMDIRDGVEFIYTVERLSGMRTQVFSKAGVSP